MSTLTLEKPLRARPGLIPPAAGETLVRVGAVVLAVFLISAPLLVLLFTIFRGPKDALPFEDHARFTLENVIGTYTDPVLYQKVLVDTLVFAVGAVVIGFSLSFLLAWLVERTDLPGRDAVFVLLLTPALMPSVIIAIAWVYLLGPNAGWVNLALRGLVGGASGPLNVFSMPGLIFVQGLTMVPFVFLLLTAALRSMDPTLEEASGASGARPLTTLRRITLPILRPGLLAPLILTSIITLEQFEMPMILGQPAQINVFSARIFWELNPPSGLPAFGRAAAIALPFLLLAFGLLAVYRRLTRRAEQFATITGKGYRPRQIPLGRWRWPSIAFVAAYLGVGVGLPLLVLLWSSFFGFTAPSVEGLGRFSLEAYANVLADPAVPLAFRNTLLVATSSALLVTGLGALISWIVLRSRMPGRRILDFLSFTSVAIPAIIAGLASMLLYLSLPLPIYGTVLVLILAYSYRLALPTRITQAGLLQIHRELEEASAASGGRWGVTFRRVLLPLLAPSMVASWLVLFVVGFREFTLAMVLHTPDNIVLSVILWRLFQRGNASEAAALAVLMMLVVTAVIVVGRGVVLRRFRPA